MTEERDESEDAEFAEETADGIQTLMLAALRASDGPTQALYMLRIVCRAFEFLVSDEGRSDVERALERTLSVPGVLDELKRGVTAVRQAYGVIPLNALSKDDENIICDGADAVTRALHTSPFVALLSLHLATRLFGEILKTQADYDLSVVRRLEVYRRLVDKIEIEMRSHMITKGGSA